MITKELKEQIHAARNKASAALTLQANCDTHLMESDYSSTIAPMTGVGSALCVRCGIRMSVEEMYACATRTMSNHTGQVFSEGV